MLKISQLREIFVVRWSVFLLGPAGCGKTAIWKTLRKAQNMLGEKTLYKPVRGAHAILHGLPKIKCSYVRVHLAECKY